MRSPPKSLQGPSKSIPPPQRQVLAHVCTYHFQDTFQSFQQNHLLQDHLSSFHDGIKNHTCGVCNETFSSRPNLLNHMRNKHTDSKNKRHQCELCDKSYTSISNFRDHFSSVHNNEVIHECKMCNETFYCRSNLQRHMRSAHEEYRYKCKLCNKDYSQSQSLKTHSCKSNSHDSTEM